MNNRTTPVYFVKVVGRFYNAENQFVATEETYAYLDQTVPNQRNPFKLIVFNAPINIARYELELTSSATSILEYRPATVLSQLVRDNSGVEVFGEVRNDQARELRGTELVVSFYDSQGAIVDVDSGYASSTTLATGAVSVYSLKTFSHFVFDSLLVQAQGYLAPS